MFGDPARIVEESEVYFFKVIGSLFGDLAFLVVTALACLRSRNWLNWRRVSDNDVAKTSIQEELIALVTALNITGVLADLRQETWLGIDMVDTQDFPDVQQWIELLAMIVEVVSDRSGQQQGQLEEQSDGQRSVGVREQKRKRDDAEDEKQPTQRTLRERKGASGSYNVCNNSDSGKCIACTREEEKAIEGNGASHSYTVKGNQ
jgi:hypothetical protein